MVVLLEGDFDLIWKYKIAGYYLSSDIHVLQIFLPSHTQYYRRQLSPLRLVGANVKVVLIQLFHELNIQHLQFYLRILSFYFICSVFHQGSICVNIYRRAGSPHLVSLLTIPPAVKHKMLWSDIYYLLNQCNKCSGATPSLWSFSPW